MKKSCLPLKLFVKALSDSSSFKRGDQSWQQIAIATCRKLQLAGVMGARQLCL
jgi:hypothetical protein